MEKFKDDEKKLLSIIKLWYNGSMIKALHWYERPWNMLDREHVGGKKYSPKQMVEIGEGDEVIRLVKLVLDKA